MNPHRAAILRRRAFFIGSALSALSGCPPDQAPAEPTPTVGVAPAPSGTELPPDPIEPAPASKMPSLEVPTDVNEIARRQFEALVLQVKAAHLDLDAASNALGGICDITAASCDEKWRTVAKHLSAFDTLIAHDIDPRCPGKSADAKRFDQRLAEHKAFMSERRAAIQQRIDGLVASASAKVRWQAHLNDAAVPRPCLDYSCDNW